MTALIVILCIIAFFILLLSVKFAVTVHSEDGIELSIRWLFIKLKILPRKPLTDKQKAKKEAKRKKKALKKAEAEKKKKKEQEDKPPDETVKEPKAKKDNVIKRYYRNRGLSGFIELIKALANALGGMGKRVVKAFRFDELYISLTVGSSDSAETAIKYGKVCAEVFPVMGFIVSNMKVGKYNLEITPDFIKGENSARFHTVISFRPISFIHATNVLLINLLFKVVIKLFKGGRKKKS